MKKQSFVLFLLIVTMILTFASCGIANKKVESIQIVSGAPTEVEVGKTPDFSDIKLKVTYNDGEIKEVGYADVKISTIDTSKVGKAEYTVSYDGGSVKVQINVKASAGGPGHSDVTLDSISYLEGISTGFFVGADFHTTALKVTANYSDGSTQTISSDKLTIVQDIDCDVVGTQTLIVEYEGKRCEIEITVSAIEPVRLELKLNSFESSVLVGRSFDTTPITGNLVYNNFNETPVENSEISFSVVDTSTAGEKVLVGKYQGFEASCNVTVLGINEIIFSGFATSIKYNQTLDLSALTASVIASNNRRYVISKEEITVDDRLFDATLDNVSSKWTKIVFSYCGESKEYNIEVTADRADSELLSLEYVSGVRTKIFVGEAFDDSAIIASANRTFGYSSIAEITKAQLTVSGTVDNTVAGTYPITYSLKEDGVEKSFTLNVTVVEPGPSNLVLSTENLGWVIKGETINTGNITATLYYEYGTKTKPISNSELTFEGVNSGVAGEIDITVKHAESGLSEVVTVTVVEIQSVTFSGVKDRYRVNNQISSEDVTISILGTNGKTYQRSFDVNATLPTLNLDITKTSEEKEYTFTYYGAEFKKNIEVYAEFEDATLLRVEHNGATRLLIGTAVDSVISVKAYYTYGFTKVYGADDGVTFEGELNTGAKGNYSITVKYQDKTANATISVEYPKVTGIVINSAPIGIKGEAYDYDSINVTITLENNETKTATFANLVDYDIRANDIDITVSGVKNLTLTSNGKTASFAVTIYEIEKIVINTENFNNVVQLGSAFSTDGLGKIVVYLKGVQEPVQREIDEFNHKVDANTRGVYQLTATYLGVTSESVQIFVADQNFVITGAEDPAPIVAWKNGVYSGKFLDSGYNYFVGDDNPFKYELKFQLFDIINNVPDTRGVNYIAKSTVTLDGIAVGNEYVIIDEEKHTFDFTEDAIGKTFIITTSHKDYPEYSKSLEVTIVDAYNVDEAIELNLITNCNETLGNSGKKQLDVLYTFLKNNNVAGIGQLIEEQYTSFVNGINGIVIHDKLTVTRSDLPEDYFFTTASGEQYLWDHQTIFNHQFTEVKLDNPETSGVAPSVFNFYGNYFTIISNNIPIVAKQGMVDKYGETTNDNDARSSSQLFRFDVSQRIFDDAQKEDKFYAENYQVNIYALGLHDNDPSVAVQPEIAQERAKLGIIGMKIRRGTYNLKAVNIEAYFTSIIEDYDDVTVNIDYCTFYNAWNNHLFLWTENVLDKNSEGKYDGSVHEGYSPVTLNITNSFIGKSGGPVIIIQNASPEAEFNTEANSRAVINIDEKTEMFSYVKGDEAWFQAYGATPIMSTLVGFNTLFEPKGGSYQTIVGNNKFINMIMINMDSDFNPAPTTMSGVTTDVDGSISIAGQTKLDMNDWSLQDVGDFKYGHGGAVDGVLMNAGGQTPPIFVSDAGGVSYTDTTNLYAPDLSALGISNSMDKAMDGDYLAMYLYNLGVLLGFNEPDMEAEPTPETSQIVRITESHGIR